MTNKKESGFIALISAIIISALLMSITFSLGFSGYFNRSAVLDGEFKEMSLALAEACAESAILSLTKDNNYAGNETISLEGGTCLIRPVLTAGSQKTIETQGIAHNSYTNLRVTATTGVPGLAVNSWQELGAF